MIFRSRAEVTGTSGILPLFGGTRGFVDKQNGDNGESSQSPDGRQGKYRLLRWPKMPPGRTVHAPGAMGIIGRLNMDADWRKLLIWAWHDTDR